MLKKFGSLHRGKRPERFQDDGEMAEEWFFHQDNAPVSLHSIVSLTANS